MPKKKRPEEKPEEQFERFVETARKIGVDENNNNLERVLKKLISKNLERPK